MVVNRVSAVLTQEVVDKLVTAIGGIETDLPFLITLTDKERASLPRFGDKNIVFINGALDMVQQDTKMMPGDFSVEEFKKDVELSNKLFTVANKLSALNEKVDDTLKEVTSEAYTTSLLVYAIAKLKGKSTGGMNSALDNLGKVFKKKTSKIIEAAPAK